MTTLARLCAVLLVGLLMNSEALSWGNATHTFYSKKLGQRFGTANLHEMYGAVMVDAFNLVFTNNGQILGGALHSAPEAMMAAAASCDLRAAAFGAASHSETWGCDWTAHRHGLTFGQDEGYIIAKSYLLAPQVAEEFIPLLDVYLDEPELSYVATAIGQEFGHDLAETAVDLLVKRYDDPAVGARMVTAAENRPDAVAGMIYATYKDTPGLVDFTPEEVALAEATYREQMTLYGGAFMMKEAETIAALSAFSAASAHDYLLGTYGFDLAITPEMVTGFIYEAIDVVKGDYRGELYATLLHTWGELKKRGITSCGSPFAVSRGEASPPAEGITNKPTDFILSDNYPNPFNPTTTISYGLPVDARVTLKVFNGIGQEVATLVDGYMPAGTHTVSWSAGGYASGVYFYRIQAGSFMETKRMILAK